MGWITVIAFTNYFQPISHLIDNKTNYKMSLQLQISTVDKAQHDKIRGRVAVLMATLRAEQAVSRERAVQVTEVGVSISNNLHVLSRAQCHVNMLLSSVTIGIRISERS